MMAPIRMAVLILMVGWFVGAGPAMADSCWDTRQLNNGKDFPFPHYFGALPPEVKRCEQTGDLLMKQLKQVRADPSLLDKENQANQGHGGLYNNIWGCCKNWVDYRCQPYPPPANQTGTYGSTQLEGKLSELCDRGVESKPKVKVPTYDPLDKSGVVKKPKFDVLH